MKLWVVYGGAGYIGSLMCKRLLEAGYKVRCVDNLHKGHADQLFGLIPDPNFEFKYGNVTIRKDVEDTMEGADYVVNLAGIVGFPACAAQPVLSEAVNVRGARNVVEARNCVVGDSVPLFYASTGSVYGSLKEVCTEDSPRNPQSKYGIDKYEGEQITIAHDNTLSYRFATCFGVSPCMRVNLLVNDLVYQAITQKCLNIFQADFRRTFIHISDFIHSIIYGLTNLKSFKHKVYNVGSDNMNWTKRELATYIGEKTGCSLTFNDTHADADQRDYEVDYSRIQNEGWKTYVTMEEGIDDLIKAVPLMRMRSPYV